MHMFKAFVWALALSIAAAACGGTDDGDTPQDDMDPQAEQDSGMAGEPGMDMDSGMPMPEAPKVDIGADQIGTVGQPLALTAEVTSEEGYEVEWKGEGLEFDDTEAADTTVTAKEPGEYTCTVKVTTESGQTASDKVKLTFNPAPQITLAGDQQLLVGEVGSLELLTPEGGTVRWSGKATMLGETEGRKTTMSFDETGEYEIKATWTDGDTTLTQSFTIHVVVPAGPLQLLMLGADNGADQTLITFLQSRDHVVTLLPPTAVSSTLDLSTYDALLISSSMDSANLDASWRDVDMPMVVWEVFALPALGMAEDPDDIGMIAPSYPYLQISGAHPLTAKHQGRVHLSTRGWTLVATPAESAIVLGAPAAGDGGDPEPNPSFFAYEPGEMMPGHSTESRRVVLPLGINLVEALTADAKDLVEAALAWVTGAGWVPRRRIMALGDSITRGTNGTDSYREPLALMLDEDECSYDFVGTLVDNSEGEPPYLFDWDHEGHGGFTTNQIRGGLLNYLDGNVPDVTLIHLGTNDLLQAVDPELARADLEDIITNLRAKNPKVTILLALLIPGNYVEGTGQAEGVPALAANVPTFNAMLTDLAAAEHSEKSPIVLVDMNTDFPLEYLDADGIHPLATGDQWMAERWYAGLAPYLTCAQP